MPSTKDRILDTAERLFAEHGYDATSLRAITSEAGVNLAAVNYHFNSKESLLKALFSRRLTLLNRKRLALLEAYESEAGNGPVALQKLVRALLEPMLRMEDEGPAGGRAFGMLLGRMYSWPSGILTQVLVHEVRAIAGRFKEAFRRALPDLPDKELYWRVFFTIGAAAHTLAASHLLKIISNNVCDASDIDAAVEELTAFVVAGLQAPRARQRKIKGKKRSAIKTGASNLSMTLNPQ